MLFQFICFEKHVITIAKEKQAWHFYEFLNNQIVQKKWCSAWSHKPIWLVIDMPGLNDNAVKNRLSCYIDTILRHHQKAVMSITINRRLTYVDTEWVRSKLKYVIMVQLALILCVGVINKYLKYQHHAALSQSQYQSSVEHQKQSHLFKKNQLKNNHLTDQLMALTQVSGLYVKKIAITHSKMTVEAYFKVSEQKRILKRLWRKSGVVSQRYNITSLKNQWRKVNYVWDFKTA